MEPQINVTQNMIYLNQALKATNNRLPITNNHALLKRVQNVISSEPQANREIYF